MYYSLLKERTMEFTLGPDIPLQQLLIVNLTRSDGMEI